MEHPLIGNLDHLTTDELSSKINDLNTKLSIAARTGNGHLCDQIRMALENYKSKYQVKLEETYKKQIADSNYGSKIDIK